MISSLVLKEFNSSFGGPLLSSNQATGLKSPYYIQWTEKRYSHHMQIFRNLTIRKVKCDDGRADPITLGIIENRVLPIGLYLESIKRV